MNLFTILCLTAAAFLYSWLLPGQARGWALLVGSVVAIYWLQPPLPIRFSDYLLPTLTLLLAVGGWWLTREERGARSEEREAAAISGQWWGEDGWTVVVVAALVVGLSFMRYVAADYRITASRPPAPLWVALALVGLGGVGAVIAWYRRGGSKTAQTITSPVVGMLVMVGLFLLLKTEPLAAAVSGWWRGLAGQDVTLASAADLNWLGFSYVAFRLIHTLRDRQTGILPALSLREYLTYIIFFPAYTAGPIDRAERFAADLRALSRQAGMGLDAARFGDGLARIVLGLFKKFVIADSLAQGVSLTVTNAAQVENTAGLWLLLYGYALRLFFDFSGYSDIAIGLGILLGVRLPENFDYPYLRSNLTAFWQSWHMTLSSWARFYVFTPLSRWLLRRPARPSPVVIVLASQLATMIVIGLWHGVTLNFFIWGVWHGLGLFAHKQWSDRTRGWYRRLGERPYLKRAWTVLAWFLTFHYVVLGWVWFLLPDTRQAVGVFGRLLGLGWPG